MNSSFGTNLDSYTLSNIRTLVDFEKLERQSKKPKLAVFFGRKLILLSYKTDSLLEKVMLIFKKITYFLLQPFRASTNAGDKIENIKKQVYQFYIDQAKKHINAEKQKLEQEVQTLQQQANKLREENGLQTIGLESLNQKREQLNNELEAISEKINKEKATYLEMVNKIRQKEQLEHEITDLQNKFHQLTQEHESKNQDLGLIISQIKRRTGEQKQQKGELDDEIKELKEELTEAQKNTLKGQNKTLEWATKGLSDKNKKLQDENYNLSAQKNRLTAENQKLKKEVNELQGKIMQLQFQLSRRHSHF